MNIVQEKRRSSTILLLPSIFFDKYHNEGNLIVNIGIVFIKWGFGMSIEFTPKKGGDK